MRHSNTWAVAGGGGAGKRGHVGSGAGFVDEDEPARVKRSLALFPTLARFGHVRPVLLRCVQSFMEWPAPPPAALRWLGNRRRGVVPCRLRFLGLTWARIAAASWDWTIAGASSFVGVCIG